MRTAAAGGELPEIAGVRGFVPQDPASPLVPADPIDDPAVLAAALPELGGGGPVDAVVLEFLRTTRELVAAQRDVVLGYLGYDPTGLGRPAPRDGTDGVNRVATTPAVPRQAQPEQARGAGIPVAGAPVTPAVPRPAPEADAAGSA
ncbi:hypothetical protein, partial [Frankia sp. AiPs1]|uniref:hypothetical protein n=1 Tax=Frankia sp. AiPs1 TaxID=573493 RepID=UPI002042BF27